jgi:L-cysteine desulfidase
VEASEITLERLEALKKEIIEEYGEDVHNVVGSTMAIAIASLTAGAVQNDVSSADCIDAFVKAVNGLNRLSDEENSRMRNRN